MVKQVATAAKGQLGIYDTLAKEHGMVSSLMNQVLEGDLETRTELFPRIYTELISHAKAEEKEFYSVLLEQEETRAKAEESLEEHEEIEDLLDRLNEMDKTSDTWLDVFSTLQATVEHHVKEEENELFPLAQKVIDGDQSKEIEDRFEQEKERLRDSITAIV
jgi:hemerythrin superfamily protein